MGEVRLLVVRLASAPPIASDAQIREQMEEANAYLRTASFGRASLRADVTQPLPGFTVPGRCFEGGDEDAGLGAFSRAARAAASAAGHDLSRYDRFVYLLPDPVCGRGGLGAGRDVLLSGPVGLNWLGLLHELGHTFRLPHAGSAACVSCVVQEYGDRTSVMGGGHLDFGAWEKAQLGWIDRVRRVGVSGTYGVAPVDMPSDGPQAVLVRVRGGTLWIEHRRSPAPSVTVRVVRRTAAGGAVRPILLATGTNVATVRGVVRVRRVAGGLALTLLDRRG